MPRLQRLGGLALLLLLAGCVATPSGRGARWYGQGSAVEVDFEVAPPGHAEALAQRGVQLPRASRGLGDPRAHREFIDIRVTAVGFGLTAGGYVLSCEGAPLPVLVPESHVDLGLTQARPLGEAIYPDRETALAALAAAGEGPPRYAWYWGAGGALIVPTHFSLASTPRIARTMLEVRRDLSQTVRRELKVLLVSLSGARVLQGVFSRLVRVGTEPAVPPAARGSATGEVPAPPQPVARAAAPGPAPAASTPAPAPGALAPSPALVQALTGRNPTPPVAPGPRLPRDIAINPKPPRQLSTKRPIGPSPTQNAQLQEDLRYLKDMGATNIRVNQQQLTLMSKRRVGIDRPDLQFDYQNRRFHVEYDTPTSGRGAAHQKRIISNDPNSDVILIIIP